MKTYLYFIQAYSIRSLSFTNVLLLLLLFHSFVNDQVTVLYPTDSSLLQLANVLLKNVV